MAAPSNPYDAVKNNGLSPTLWALGLVALPAPPVTLADVLALRAPCDPVPIAVTGEAFELIADALLQVECSFQLNPPPGAKGPTSIQAVAVVHGSPADYLVGVASTPAGAIDLPSTDALLAQLRIVVAKVPG